jgi:hypothetical protein
MNGRWHKTLVALMWLALPITAVDYSRNWDRLPTRMAVHFDANWQPNGYTSREGALELGLGVMVFMLVVSTVGLLIAHALRPAAAWPLLVVFYVTIGFVWFGNHSIIKWNLNPPPAHSELMGPDSPAVRDSSAAKFLTLHS